MSSQGWCRVGVAVSGEQLVWCSGNITESSALDKHRSVCYMAARVLQGLAGLNEGRPEGPWRTGPPGEQLLPHCHSLSGTGAGVELPVGWGSDSVSERRVCEGGVFVSVLRARALGCVWAQSHLQLPNLSGQAWASMGKSSRCMGHSALTVSLQRVTQVWTVHQGKKKSAARKIR